MRTAKKLPKLEILVLRGLPKSGKTTFAYAYMEEHKNFRRVSRDEIRQEIYAEGAPHNQASEKLILDTEIEEAMYLIEAGYSVIVDDTNLADDTVDMWRLVASKLPGKIGFKVELIDTPLRDCLLRNARGNSYTPQRIIEQAAGEKYGPVYDESLDECIMVDIDGTLAHIDPENPRDIYDASRAINDLVDDAVSNITAMAYENGYKVIIVTGRKKSHLAVTKEWLSLHGINYDEIYCRKALDKRPDELVKMDIYEDHINGKYNVKYVIDDRPKVCRMWRALGLKTLQVGDPHEEI